MSNRQIDHKATLNQALSIKQLLEDLNQVFEILPLASGSSLRCFCPIHKSNAFRTLLIDIDHRSFKCSYTQCPGNIEGTLIDLFSLTFNCSPEVASEYWGRKVDGINLTLDDLKTMEKHLQSLPKLETPPPEIKPEIPEETVIEQAMPEPSAPLETEKKKLEKIGNISDVEFMEALNKELARAKRFRMPFSVVVVHLVETAKSPSHTHAMNCDVELFQSLVKQIRPYDTLANFGIHQFSFLFPQVTKVQTRLVIKRIKKCIQTFLQEKYPDEYGLQYGFGYFDGYNKEISSDTIIAKALDNLLENISSENLTLVL
jgi:GGDEF domain-containing protein